MRAHPPPLALGAPAQMAVHQHQDHGLADDEEAGGDHQNAHGLGRHGQGRQALRCRQGNITDRSHAAEMHAQDGGDAQAYGGDIGQGCGFQHREMAGKAAQRKADQDGGGDNPRVPDRNSGQLHRGHADIVHGQDRGTPQRASQDAASADEDHGKGGRHRNNDDQGRQHGQADVKAHGQAGIVGQHGDEMRGPHAHARHHAAAKQPVQADPPLPAGAATQTHGASGDAGEQTDREGGRHQPGVMLLVEASKNDGH